MRNNLGERHIRLSAAADHHRTMPLWILRESDEEIAKRTDIDENVRDYLDFGMGISGDDLARLGAFADDAPKLETIGAQKGVHSGTRIVTTQQKED